MTTILSSRTVASGWSQSHTESSKCDFRSCCVEWRPLDRHANPGNLGQISIRWYEIESGMPCATCSWSVVRAGKPNLIINNQTDLLTPFQAKVNAHESSSRK